MDVVEFFGEFRRMCRSSSDCTKCQYHGDKCDNAIELFEKTVAVVEQWSREHPRNTRQSKFLDMFPTAGVDDAAALGVSVEQLCEVVALGKAGRLMVLPCKVGDRLYEVTGRKTISVYKVRAIRVELFGLFIEWGIVEGFVWQSLSGINAGEIGKTVFLTREEAEKVLEAMK